MGMTMTQKILAAHARLPSVNAGDLIRVGLDMVLGNDITTPVAINEFEKAGFDKVFDKSRIAIVLDHFTPSKDMKTALLCKQSRDFASKQDIDNFYDVGRMGIEHLLLPEKGLVAAGECIIGADSHTCTYGALGAFSTGIGSTDMAAAMAAGQAWFKVPEAMRVHVTGKLADYVSGKDVILQIISMIGVEGASYQSMEFTGEGIKNLTIDDRFCMANMVIEAGAKNGIFPVDEQTVEYMKGRVDRAYSVYEADADAAYTREIHIDLSRIKLTVAFPHLPENAKTIDECGEVRIDQVVIGSCTNGRLSDMKIAADLLRGKKIHKNVRAIIIPATQEVYKQCVKLGYIEDFIDAGCAVSTPTCGPCMGGHLGILTEGERCVATINRNFVGRMGHINSEVYLAGPAVAAASCITGKISEPKEVL